jgi:hypothetical protein
LDVEREATMVVPSSSSSIPPPGDDPGNENGGSGSNSSKRNANSSNGGGKQKEAAQQYPGVKGGWFTESCLLWPGQRLSLALEVQCDDGRRRHEVNI